MAGAGELVPGLVVCGRNALGQLGLGDTMDRTRATVAHGIEAVAAAVHASHTLVVVAGGQVYASGDGEHGKLGLGNTNRQTAFTLIDTLASVRIVAVAAGGSHSLAVSDDGALYTWGNGDYGQLGFGEPLSGPQRRSTPERVTVLAGVAVASAAAGNMHSLVLTKEGKALSFGRGDYGQLGHAEGRITYTPRAIADLEAATVTHIAAGWDHSIFTLSDGQVCTCGRAESGQLGHGDTVRRLQPMPVAALKGMPVLSASGGQSHTLFLIADGSVYGCGQGDNGRLGVKAATRQLAPVHLSTLVDVVQVAAGVNHSAAVTKSGQVFAFGPGDNGRLGSGSSMRLTLPTPMVDFPGVARAVYSGNHNVILADVPFDPAAIKKATAKPQRVPLAGVAPEEPLAWLPQRNADGNNQTGAPVTGNPLIPAVGAPQSRTIPAKIPPRIVALNGGAATTPPTQPGAPASPSGSVVPSAQVPSAPSTSPVVPSAAKNSPQVVPMSIAEAEPGETSPPTAVTPANGITLATNAAPEATDHHHVEAAPEEPAAMVVDTAVPFAPLSSGVQVTVADATEVVVAASPVPVEEETAMVDESEPEPMEVDSKPAAPVAVEVAPAPVRAPSPSPVPQAPIHVTPAITHDDADMMRRVAAARAAAVSSNPPTPLIPGPVTTAPSPSQHPQQPQQPKVVARLDEPVVASLDARVVQATAIVPEPTGDSSPVAVRAELVQAETRVAVVATAAVEPVAVEPVAVAAPAVVATLIEAPTEKTSGTEAGVSTPMEGLVMAQPPTHVVASSPPVVAERAHSPRPVAHSHAAMSGDGDLAARLARFEQRFTAVEEENQAMRAQVGALQAKVAELEAKLVEQTFADTQMRNVFFRVLPLAPAAAPVPLEAIRGTASVRAYDVAWTQPALHRMGDAVEAAKRADVSAVVDAGEVTGHLSGDAACTPLAIKLVVCHKSKSAGALALASTPLRLPIHPHIQPLYHAFVAAPPEWVATAPNLDVVYTVGPPLGPSLAGYRLSSGGTVTPLARDLGAAVFLLQLMDAVAFLAEHGIVHRNICLDAMHKSAAGQIVLGDFSAVFDREALRGAAGSPRLEVMPPEAMAELHGIGAEAAAAAGGAMTERYDVWSVGIAVHEVLCGVHPFEAEGRGGSRELNTLSRTFEPRALPNDMNADLRVLARSLLAKHPDKRPGAHAVIATLLEWMDSVGAATHTGLRGM